MTAGARDIAANLAAVRAQLADAAVGAGRDPSVVRLVAVSKMHPADAVRAAYDAGQRDFGENYVQEFAAKADALADLADLRWHFIGHLQTNKARDVVGRASWVHGVDSERLLRELDKRAAAAGRALDVLLQVNVAGEAQKSGCAVEEVPALVTVARELTALSLRGLMTVPPLVDDAEASRPWFEALRSLRDAHGGAAALPELSMGMSHDLGVAVACGATMVRVGTAIFGAR